MLADEAGAGGDKRYGMQQSELENVYQKIHTELIDNAIEKIKARDAVNNAISDGWHGPDCVKFLENFVALGDSIAAQLDAYDKAIAAEFYKVAAQWDEFQTSNVK